VELLLLQSGPLFFRWTFFVHDDFSSLPPPFFPQPRLRNEGVNCSPSVRSSVLALMVERCSFPLEPSLLVTSSPVEGASV